MDRAWLDSETQDRHHARFTAAERSEKSEIEKIIMNTDFIEHFSTVMVRRNNCFNRFWIVCFRVKKALQPACRRQYQYFFPSNSKYFLVVFFRQYFLVILIGLPAIESHDCRHYFPMYPIITNHFINLIYLKTLFVCMHIVVILKGVSDLVESNPFLKPEFFLMRPQWIDSERRYWQRYRERRNFKLYPPRSVETFWKYSSILPK